MEALKTIQKREKLNEVYRMGEPGPGGAYHDYAIVNAETQEIVAAVEFQKGHRNDPEARNGALDCDLVEMVRDRMKTFQEGEFECRENHMALFHLEEALYWMNKRVEKRAERGVLGTYNK